MRGTTLPDTEPRQAAAPPLGIEQRSMAAIMYWLRCRSLDLEREREMGGRGGHPRPPAAIAGGAPARSPRRRRDRTRGGGRAPRARRRRAARPLRVRRPPRAGQGGARAWREGGGVPPSREAFLVVFDPVAGATLEAVVDVPAARVVDVREVPGVQPAITPAEYVEAERVAKADRAFRAALARARIDDVELVMIDAWSAGTGRGPGAARRPRGLSWLRADPTATTATRGRSRASSRSSTSTRMRGRCASRTTASCRSRPSPATTARRRRGPTRSDLKPLEITQPEGPSFTVEGTARALAELAVPRRLHAPRGARAARASARSDGGRARPVLHRASISEMVVPYGDPARAMHRKNAFDVGEYGIGHAGQLARARLRLPRRDPLLRRRD